VGLALDKFCGGAAPVCPNPADFPRRLPLGGVSGCGFPLRLRWQATSRPSGVGVGLKIADVAYRCCLHLAQWKFSAQREETPFPNIARPIERRAPAVVLDGVPPGGEPEFRPSVPTVGDELGIFAASDRECRQRVWIEPDPVALQFVVEAKAVAVVANSTRPPGKSTKCNGTDCCCESLPAEFENFLGPSRLLFICRPQRMVKNACRMSVSSSSWCCSSWFARVRSASVLRAQD